MSPDAGASNEAHCVEETTGVDAHAPIAFRGKLGGHLGGVT